MNDFIIHSEDLTELDEQIMNLVKSGLGKFDEETFNHLALREFAIQFNNIEIYKNYCLENGLTPENAKKWEDIPAMSSEVFKKTVIATFSPSDTELTLLTSGTSNPNSPSKIYRDKRSVEMQFLANKIITKEYLFPDVDRMRILLMVPSPKVAPAMGMAVGLEEMRKNFGTEDSMYLITPDGMEWELLFKALHEAEENGKPIALVGATSGLVLLFNFCREQGISLKLPAGSRICDGGGYIGTFGDCSREDYLKLCQEILDVPAQYCVNTLGSGESATNYFDNVLHNYYLGIKDASRYKICPPWVRTIVIDPETGKRKPKGEIGQIVHYDLVNRANLLAVRTNNIGYEIEDGFEIIGRIDAKDKTAFSDLNKMITGQNVCSTVADNMLGGQNVCSTVADKMLGGQNVCSTVADKMLDGQNVCSTVADKMLGGQNVCSTVADKMLGGQNVCSTVADKMLGGQNVCSTVADKMLGGQNVCSTVADNMLNTPGAISNEDEELLQKSPHGNIFKYLSKERFDKLKQLCPFLKLKEKLKDVQ